MDVFRNLHAARRFVVTIFVGMVIVARLRREAQKAAIEAKQLGQYVLDRKLGQGGLK